MGQARVGRRFAGAGRCLEPVDSFMALRKKSSHFQDFGVLVRILSKIANVLSPLKTTLLHFTKLVGLVEILRPIRSNPVLGVSETNFALTHLSGKIVLHHVFLFEIAVFKLCILWPTLRP